MYWQAIAKLKQAKAIAVTGIGCIPPPINFTFDNTQSQESKSEVWAQEFYAAIRIKTH